MDRVFRMLDVNGTGRIGRMELVKVCERVLSVSLANEDVSNILSSVDTDQNGFIDYAEFIVAAIDKKKLLCKGRLETAFQAFDRDSSGKISA